MQEIFKDIPGYEGMYQVSNFGRVKSLSRLVNSRNNGFRRLKEKILTQNIELGGYPRVNLSVSGKMRFRHIHQLVAETFLGHIPDKYFKVVDHKDNNKLNNNLSNLQIIDQRKNASKDKSGATSQYTGVRFRKEYNKWSAEIRINGPKKHLGTFDTEYEAHLAYQEALNTLLATELKIPK